MRILFGGGIELVSCAISSLKSRYASFSVSLPLGAEPLTSLCCQRLAPWRSCTTHQLSCLRKNGLFGIAEPSRKTTRGKPEVAATPRLLQKSATKLPFFTPLSFWLSPQVAFLF